MKAVPMPAGSKWGRWTVVDGVPLPGRRVSARCACGTVAEVLAFTLRNGLSTGCTGCRNRASVRRLRSNPSVAAALEGHLLRLEGEDLL